MLLVWSSRHLNPLKQRLSTAELDPTRHLNPLKQRLSTAGVDPTRQMSLYRRRGLHIHCRCSLYPAQEAEEQQECGVVATADMNGCSTFSNAKTSFVAMQCVTTARLSRSKRSNLGDWNPALRGWWQIYCSTLQTSRTIGLHYNFNPIPVHLCNKRVVSRLQSCHRCGPLGLDLGS